MKIRKTIKVTSVTAKIARFDLEKKEYVSETVTVALNGKVNESRAENMLKSMYPNAAVHIEFIDNISEKYEISVDEFKKHATLVEA